MRLYDTHLTDVYSYACNRVGRDAAEDLTADVFVAALEAIRRGNRDINGAWLIGVARNKAIDQWRRRTVRDAKRHLLGVKAVEMPFDWVDDGLSENIMFAIEAISQRHRTLLVLQVIHGLSVNEIADRFDETPSAIESALKRGAGIVP